MELFKGIFNWAMLKNAKVIRHIVHYFTFVRVVSNVMIL